MKLLIGDLERRLLQPLKDPPLEYLIPLADPDVPLDRKREVAVDLFDALEENLDAALAKIRRMAGYKGPDDKGDPIVLLSAEWQEFIFH